MELKPSAWTWVHGCCAVTIDSGSGGCDDDSGGGAGEELVSVQGYTPHRGLSITYVRCNYYLVFRY